MFGGKCINKHIYYSIAGLIIFIASIILIIGFIKQNKCKPHEKQKCSKTKNCKNVDFPHESMFCSINPLYFSIPLYIISIYILFKTYKSKQSNLF